MAEVEQLYTGCLAEAAYFIVSGDEAVVIDPLRDVEVYLRKAAEKGCKIKFVIETHFHADFCSGHVDLATKSGATIVFGPTAQPGFEAKIAADGEVLKFGKSFITVLHTPGHTMESSCFLLQDEGAEKPKAIFTGDTLFIGDVGRPDLAAGVNADLTAEKLATLMYESLRSKIMPLHDDLIVYPAHGAGSACGKNLSTQTWDTLGNQKRNNYALSPTLEKDLFVLELIAGQPPAPGYFIQNVLINKTGKVANVDVVMQTGHKALKVPEFKTQMSVGNPFLMDTRPAAMQAATGTIPGFVYVSLEDGSFAPWFATAFPLVTRPILLLCENEARVTEAQTRLARVGCDNVVGYLEGSIEAWKAAGEPVVDRASMMVTCGDMSAALKADPQCQIVDVRRPTEWAVEHFDFSHNFPMDPEGFELAAGTLNKEKPVYCYCRTGYRGMIFATALKEMYGFKQVYNVLGGHFALRDDCKAGGLVTGMCPRKAAELLAQKQLMLKKIRGEAE